MKILSSKSLHNVHNSFNHNKQKLETTQMPTHRWMVKQIVTYPYNGIFLSNKKEWSNDTHNKGGILIVLNEQRQICVWFHLYEMLEDAN